MPPTPAERELYIALRRAYKAMFLAFDRYFAAESKAAEADPEQTRSG